MAGANSSSTYLSPCSGGAEVCFLSAMDLVGENAAEFTAFLEINVHDFEADLGGGDGPDHDLGAQVLHAAVEFESGFRAEAQGVFFARDTASQAEFANDQVRFSPRATRRCRKGARRDDALVTAEAVPRPLW